MRCGSRGISRSISIQRSAASAKRLLLLIRFWLTQYSACLPPEAGDRPLCGWKDHANHEAQVEPASKVVLVSQVLYKSDSPLRRLSLAEEARTSEPPEE